MSFFRSKYLSIMKKKYDYIVTSFDYSYFTLFREEYKSIYFSSGIIDDLTVLNWINEIIIQQKEITIFGEKQLLDVIIDYCGIFINGNSEYGNQSRKIYKCFINSNNYHQIQLKLQQHFSELVKKK